jgi:lipopolysaccharide export system permease protein
VGFWLRQRTELGQTVINAAQSRGQGVDLSGVTVFTFDNDGRFDRRIEARRAQLAEGHWRIEDAQVYSTDAPPEHVKAVMIRTNLTSEQIRENFATPETVSFWELPGYIKTAEQLGLAATTYRLQYQVLLVRPFLLAAMVILAASFSLRFFRFGGVQHAILGGVGAGFLLYVLQKVTEDLGKAELMHPAAAAWLPVLVGGLTGFLALLYQEDG